MTILKQDLFQKNEIIKIPAPLPPKIKKEQTTKKAHTKPADCRQWVLFQLSTESVSQHLLKGLQQNLSAAVSPQVPPRTTDNSGPTFIFQLPLSTCPQHK